MVFLLLLSLCAFEGKYDPPHMLVKLNFGRSYRPAPNMRTTAGENGRGPKSLMGLRNPATNKNHTGRGSPKEVVNDSETPIGSTAGWQRVTIKDIHVLTL